MNEVAQSVPDRELPDRELLSRYGCGPIRFSGHNDRLRALLAHVDMIRLDHFRAFAAAWHVPAGSATAETGTWVLGPGADFFATERRWADFRSSRRTWD